MLLYSTMFKFVCQIGRPDRGKRLTMVKVPEGCDRFRPGPENPRSRGGRSGQGAGSYQPEPKIRPSRFSTQECFCSSSPESGLRRM